MKVAYQIRRSARVKLARIVVTPDKIEVVAPPAMTARQIAQFVAAKEGWITAAVTRVTQQARSHVKLAPACYEQGALIPYQGKLFPLQLKPAAVKRLKVSFEGTFQVVVPETLAGAEQEAAIKLALCAWMKHAIKAEIDQYVQQHAHRFQLIPSIVRVKTQKSRWGSCSSQNAININWLLILAPPVVLEYVVVHELCHIKEKNHSAAFWQLVADHLPHYQQHRHWLKQHGASLMGGL